MARVKIKGLKAVNKLISKTLDESLTSPKATKSIGEFIVDRIKGFTRSGKSIAGPKAKKLKKLSKSYVDMRRGAVMFRKTKDGRTIGIPEPDPILKQADREFFRPDLSNLTMTGQMLHSLKFFFDRSTRTFTIEPTGSRRKAPGAKKALSNKEVAGHVADNGRPFIGLDDKGVERVKKMILKEIRNQLRRNGLKKT